MRIGKIIRSNICHLLFRMRKFEWAEKIDRETFCSLFRKEASWLFGSNPIPVYDEEGNVLFYIDALGEKDGRLHNQK